MLTLSLINIYVFMGDFFMKKICVLIISVFCLILMCGCGYNNIVQLASENVAECREVMYVGSNQHIKVNMISGMRERNYVVNGYCTEGIEFGVITFTILDDIEIDNANYVLTVGTTRYDGLLERNPYDLTYMCDIKKNINTSEVVTAKIIAGEFVECVELVNITNNWNVNSDNALKIAVSQLSKQLKPFVDNGEFKGECYIKIVSDDEINDVYYWYVSFVGRDNTKLAVIIDPISNEVLSSKSA